MGRGAGSFLAPANRVCARIQPNTPTMKNYPPVKFGKLLRASGLAGAGLSLALAAFAQNTTAATPGTDENDTLKLERFVVTGSNLPSAGETPVAPLSLLTPE